MVNYPKWNEVSYAGENAPPKNVETPYAESWNMYYYTHIGVGYVEDGNYWNQLFIGK
ncbi:hypothetical protein [Bacillus coahuilensis]|uniref:hypothetical protein n=1 Tax=Bacillus coahuilensis TaxID=408580 RepID=UPI000185113A|nr:hypothetical protein [Bacillus coahuilensis]